ncbi:bifunctional 2-polyprenyl-6-hydroxyphenol methylase/3-demethylubiquinol 3-O-methyltransferase UbiG [Diaphorobacter sp. MNS-0]|nr:methyltransferase domain-containing protein [Diaphorobacter sp. MNS-0]
MNTANGHVFLQQQDVARVHSGGGRANNRTMPHIETYLLGEAFSDDLPFRPGIIGHAQPRGDLLAGWVAQQCVLHVGFADHAPLIARRASDGSWLHALLSRNARICHGIDINATAVDTARSLGFDHVQQLDVFAPEAPQVLARCAPDMVLVPDVIEHLPDPAAFLRRLAQCLPEAEFVVSVPNALSLRNALHSVCGVEHVNTDHRAWFSPFTLLKVLADAGLVGAELHSCQVAAPGTMKGRLLHRLAVRRPLWADVLVARVKAR